jgi:hypothetical protein
MDESSSNENTSTEMLAEEEDLWWDLHPLDLLCNDGKATTTNGRKEHDDCPNVS